MPLFRRVTASSNEQDAGLLAHDAAAPARHGNDRTPCPSFLVKEPAEEAIVRFVWDGQSSIDLELARAKTAPRTQVVHWTEESLGITFGIEETSRRVIVTRTTREDVRVGYVLLQAMGQEINEANFDERMGMLKRAHQISRGIPFVFSTPPPPVFVKTCGHQLLSLGVDNSFELRFVADQAIRYLSLEELHEYIRRAPKPCALTFIQRKDSQHIAALQKQAGEDAVVAGVLAATAAAVAVSIA